MVTDLGWRQLSQTRFALVRYRFRPTGQRCDVCEQPISAEQLEYEVDVDRRTLRFHEKCFDMWRQARG